MSSSLVMNEAVDVHDGLGEGVRGLLRQVVPDAAADHPVLVLAGELAGAPASRRSRSS
jgi:signal transduction protein with GAF and PtsI domain